MSEHRFTEVTQASWLSRIKGAIKGILTGLILFAVAFPLLFWNEGRSVKQHQTLKEGAGAVVSVPSDSVDPANAGKLLHMTGKAQTDATLTDPVFGVSANALKLKRVVEMYQWEEKSQSQTKKKLGGGTETVTTYTYNKTWSDSAIGSADFKQPAGHQNPGAMPYPSTVHVAKQVTLGAFTLSPALVGKINNFEPLFEGSDTPLPEPLKTKARLDDSGFYLGTNPASPQVGDARVHFEVAPPTEVSVIAKQVDSTFEPYGTKAGGTIELLQTGVHSAGAMIQRAQDSNRMLTWILRFVGFALMFIGLSLVLKPLSVLADVLPILGSIVGAGTGVVSFLLAVVLSLITVGVAWLVYRPLVGIILIGVAVGLTVVIKGRLKPGQQKGTLAGG